MATDNPFPDHVGLSPRLSKTLPQAFAGRCQTHGGRGRARPCVPCRLVPRTTPHTSLPRHVARPHATPPKGLLNFDGPLPKKACLACCVAGTCHLPLPPCRGRLHRRQPQRACALGGFGLDRAGRLWQPWPWQHCIGRCACPPGGLCGRPGGPLSRASLDATPWRGKVVQKASCRA